MDGSHLAAYPRVSQTAMSGTTSDATHVGHELAWWHRHASPSDWPRRTVGVGSSTEHDEHGRCRFQGDPKAEAHAGRTTKPTPRTVWMSLGSPSFSVLRRR
jgi:hypothetical protein